MTTASMPTPAAPDWRPGDGRAAPAWRSTLAQTTMELRLTARRGENLLVTLVIPVVLLLFFGSVDVLPSTTSTRPIDALLPGILALAIISTSLVNLGIATAYERSYGVLKRLGGSPLPRTGLIGAKMLAILVVELVQLILLVAIATVVFGWSPGSTSSLVLVVGGVLLGTLVFAGLGLLMAGTLRAEATLAGANGLYLIFLLLGGIVLPVDQLPGILADLARILPAAALSDVLRIGLGGATGDASGSLLLLAGWGLVATGLATRRFRWE